jgi:hypothetical protein
LAEQRPEEFLEMANGQVRAAYALRDDLLAVLFPHGDTLPSELLQTRVKLKLLALVDGIERQLIGESLKQRSWGTLSRSGLLREKALIHFALARIAEERIHRNLQAAGASSLAQLPARLMGDDNANLAEMARKLLQAERNNDDSSLYLTLDPEILHILTWRVVAALQQQGDDGETILANAKAMLAAHDDDANPANAARKLVFFLGPDYREALLRPEIAGLHLFVAGISQSSGLDSDLLFRLIDEARVEPLALLLRGNGVDPEQIDRAMVLLRGAQASLSPELLSQYAAIDPIDARSAIANWQSAP